MAISSNGDKYFSNVSLLLPFDGANGSTGFYDASPVPKAVTTSGNTTISTTQSKFGGSSGYFDGTGDYLTFSDSSYFNFPEDFTMECWINASYYTAGIIGTTSFAPIGIVILSGKLGISHAGSVTSGTTDVYTLGGWHHVALVRVKSSNTAYLYVDGILEATKTGVSDSFSSTGFTVGRAPDVVFFSFTGYIDSVRVTKGIARYTTSFTPPTAPFPTDWEDVADPYYDNVVLHLPMDGPENGTTFVDRSKTPKTVTTVGNTKLLATQSKFGGSSGYFDGTGDYLSISGTSDLVFGTGDFTIEAWVYTSNIIGGTNVTLDKGIFGSMDLTPNLLFFLDTEANRVRFWDNTTEHGTSTSVAINTWTHIAVTRDSTSLKIFINGLLSYTGTCSVNFSSTGTTYIGSGTGTNRFFNGYIDSLRITKGTARYTSNFTVPTGPFAIGKPYVADPYASNVKLLLTGSGANGTQAFRDESGLNNVITVSGNTVVDRNRGRVGGGSIYFDGTGDWLYTNNAIFSCVASGDFTYEAWVYKTTASMGAVIGLDASTGSLMIDNITPTIQFGTYNYASSSIILNTWQHIALVKQGTLFTWYINGINAGTFTKSVDIAASKLWVGGAGSNFPFTGYINNIRVTSGTARYTGNFTPEYSYLLPPTAITSGDALYDNTVLTLRLDGNYVDSSPKNNTVTAYGNASLSASTYKYGTGSLSLDGVGDYIATPDIADFRFGTGDFCMECWIYPTMTSFADINCIFDHKTGSPSGWYLYLNWQGKVELYNSSSYLTGNTALTKNVWTHIAVTRSSGSVTIWVNGVADCTPSSGGINTDYTGATTYFGIGALINQRDSRYDFKGYIDNVRITKGTARYTTTFTPADIESSSVSGPVRAYSVQSITSNGAVKFTIPVAGVIQAGFSTNASTDITKNDLEYSIQIDSSKVLTIVEAGVVKATKGTASDGTNFEIEYSGTTMTYKSNGAQLLTTTVTAGMTLYFSAFIEDTGLYVTGIQIGTYASDGTPGNISGQITADNISTYIAGAAIDTAYIKDLAVKTAKIDNLAVTTGKINDLAVETLKIAGNSISKVYAASGGTITINDISVINDPLVQLTNIVVPGSSTAVVIVFNATYYNNTSATRGDANFKLYRDNSVITDITGYDSAWFNISAGAGDIYTITKVFVDNAITTGTHSYQMKPQSTSFWTINTNGNLILKDITLYAVPLLR